MDEEPEIGPAAAVRLVEAAVDNATVSAAVLAVGRGADDEGDLHVFGRTRLGAEGSPVSADTLFDLASLTKVVATTPAVLRLADAGELDVDDPVARYLPSYSDGQKAAVTLRHLLTHSSGLPPHRAFHEMPGSAEQRLAAVAEEPLTAAPGTQVVYSDLGFILLGAIVAQVAGAGLDRAARELVFDPLDLKSTGYLPSVHLSSVHPSSAHLSTAPPERFAATEIQAETGEPLIGSVHDENAAALGGVAGHAGVFSTVGDMVRYLRVGWLDQGRTFLSERSRKAALACGTERLDGRRGLGWTLAGDRWDHMTAAWPRTRAGHTGFTGTSLALDPETGLWTVLLTNAVHLGRDHSGIALLRRTVHAAVAAWAETLAAPGDPQGARRRAGAGYDQPVRIQGD